MTNILPCLSIIKLSFLTEHRTWPQTGQNAEVNGIPLLYPDQLLYNYCPVLSINACHYVLVTKASLSRSVYLEVLHDMKEQGIHEILKTCTVQFEWSECEVYHFFQHMMCFLMIRLLFDNTSQNLIRNSFFFAQNEKKMVGNC